MAEALPLTSMVSQSSSSDTDFETLTVKFGNGYEQRSEDGINTEAQKWVITYNNIGGADRTTLWTFIRIVKRTAWFTWTPPGGVSTKFVIDGPVNERALSGDYYTVTFPIRQVYDLM
jgi:phage-related protein